MDAPAGPLLTAAEAQALLAARATGGSPTLSLDLGRSRAAVVAGPESWQWQGRAWPYPPACKERTVYYWDGAAYLPVARQGRAFVKLVPTEWGAPTMEIDGVKMLPSARLSPWDDAGRKVALIEPRGRRVLDTCGGLGYFAAWCLERGAASVHSWEVNPEVRWLRSLNPWSPEGAAARAGGGAGAGADARLALTAGDVHEAIARCETGSFDAALHDPPRFSLAGELYSLRFYEQLARVLRRGGRLFHYTGAPNSVSRGRDLPGEVLRRLGQAGFAARREGDGVLATRR